MTRYWLLPCNPQKFDIKNALEKFGGYVDWRKKKNIKNNDVVYLYESNPTHAITAKFVVVNDSIAADSRFRDEEFWHNESSFDSDTFTRMRCIKVFDSPIPLKWLKENGLKSNIQSAEKINTTLLKNIRMVEFSELIKKFPEIKKSPRDREYSQYTESVISKIVESYLVQGKSHRKIDEEVLNFDSKKSKGYQAMGVLHYLGLVDNHKGFLANLTYDEVVFILENVPANDILAAFSDVEDNIQKSDLEILDDYVTRVKAKEGKKIEIYTYKYERNPKLRAEAIRLHGFTCRACGFNFEEHYGNLGKEYIEIHHVQPLYSFNEEKEIDPSKDLVPLCSNCHRMIHRKKDSILSIEELKNILNAAH